MITLSLLLLVALPSQEPVWEHRHYEATYVKAELLAESTFDFVKTSGAKEFVNEKRFNVPVASDTPVILSVEGSGKMATGEICGSEMLEVVGLAPLESIATPVISSITQRRYEALGRLAPGRSEIVARQKPPEFDYAKYAYADVESGSFRIKVFRAVRKDEEVLLLKLSDPSRAPLPPGIKFPISAAEQGRVVETPWIPSDDITGVAADGVSLLLVRLERPVAGKATFGLAGDGALFPLAGNPFESGGSASIEVPLTPIKSGSSTTYVGMVLYRPPSHVKEASAPLALNARFVPEDGKNKSGLARREIRIVRPPVVLVHGTYDNPKACWNTKEADDGPLTMVEALNGAGYSVSSLDWEATNGLKDPSSFEVNEKTVSIGPGGIRETLDRVRAKGVVATQVDIVAHSQGGVIARVFARGRNLSLPMAANDPHFSDPQRCRQGGCWYHTSETYGMGSIHRLITISSTHRGSAVTTFFQAVKAYSAAHQGVGIGFDDYYRLFVWGVQTFVSGVVTEGFTDQVPGSARLRAIGPTPVASHAIACAASDELMETLKKGEYRDKLNIIWTKTATSTYPWLFKWMDMEKDGELLVALADREKLIALPGSGTDPTEARRTALRALRAAIFRHEDNDCTVSVPSSFGGLEPPYRTRIDGVLHGWAGRQPSVQNRVLELLGNSGELFDPQGFPDAYTGARADVTAQPLPLKSATAPKAQAPGGTGAPLIGTGTAAAAGGANKTAGGPAAYFADAESKWKKGELDEAASALSKAIVTQPHDAAIRASYSAVLFYQRKWNEAEIQSKEAVRLEPKNADYRGGHGTALYYQGDFAQAVDEYKEAVRIRPNSPEYHASMAVCQTALGRIAEAEGSYREAIKWAPQHAGYRIQLGDLLGMQQKWEQAFEPFDAAVRIDPMLPAAHFGLGGVWFTRGKFNESEACYRRAVELAPTVAVNHAQWAGALLRCGKREAAVKAAREAQRLGLTTHWVFTELFREVKA